MFAQEIGHAVLFLKNGGGCKNRFGVQNHKNPKKRHFCEKPRKLAKTTKMGGVVLGVENRGFRGGGEKRRFSGVQNADFRVSQDFGTPRQNTYYLVCRHPPGGSHFTPPKTPKNTPPDHHNSRCGFGVEFRVFPGFPDMLQKPRKSTVLGFHPKCRFSGFYGRMPIALHTIFFDDAIIVVDPSSWCSWCWILSYWLILVIKLMFQLINMMMVEPWS